jgi:hypothetical protein
VKDSERDESGSATAARSLETAQVAALQPPERSIGEGHLNVQCTKAREFLPVVLTAVKYTLPTIVAAPFNQTFLSIIRTQTPPNI